MKRSILILALTIITLSGYAQSDTSIKRISPPGMNNNPNQPINDSTIKDGVLMQNGEMVTVKNGRMIAMDKDVTLRNGTKVSTNGTVTKSDGTKITLKEGEHIDHSGNMIIINRSKYNVKKTTPTTPDKNMYLVPDSTLKKNK